MGYRHIGEYFPKMYDRFVFINEIDCAWIYLNQNEVGDAIKKCIPKYGNNSLIVEASFPYLTVIYKFSSIARGIVYHIQVVEHGS